MKICFQADADLRQTIVAATVRREPSIDFRTALAAGLPGLKDPQVLATAAASGRVLVTHDAKSMPRHFGEFILEAESPGVLIVPQRLPIRVAVEELLLIWVATEAGDWVNRICRLPL